MSLGASSSNQHRSRRLPLAVAALFAFTSLVALAGPTQSLAWDPDSYDPSSEAELIALTNRSRANAGLSTLKVDAKLTAIARWRSQDMIERDYFSHTIPGYGKVFNKLDEEGYCYTLAGENIGWNTYPADQATAAIHQMFMDSSGHRSNILGERWDVIGVGAYTGAGRQEDVDGGVCRQVRRGRHSEANSKGDTQAHSQTHTKANGRAHSGAHRRALSEAHAETDLGTDCHADAGSQAYAGSHADADARFDADAHPHANALGSADTRTDPASRRRAPIRHRHRRLVHQRSAFASRTAGHR